MCSGSLLVAAAAVPKHDDVDDSVRTQQQINVLRCRRSYVSVSPSSAATTTTTSSHHLSPLASSATTRCMESKIATTSFSSLFTTTTSSSSSSLSSSLSSRTSIWRCNSRRRISALTGIHTGHLVASWSQYWKWFSRYRLETQRT